MKQKRFLIFLLLCLLLPTGCHKRTFEEIKITERTSQKYTQAELLDVMKIAFDKKKEESVTDKDIYEMEYAGDKNSAEYSNYLVNDLKKQYDDCLVFFALCDDKETPLLYHVAMVKTEKGWELESFLPQGAALGLPDDDYFWKD